MLFDGSEGAPISLSEAASLTQNYQTTLPAADAVNEKGIFFGHDALKRMLAQPDCVGIRMYFAHKANGKPTLVITGVDASGNDLISESVATEGVICSSDQGNISLLGT